MSALPLPLQRFTSAVRGLGAIATAVIGASGGLRSRMSAALGVPAAQRGALAALRFAKPRLALERNLIKCYPAQRSLILTRAADFHEVIRRQGDFEVVYAPRMRKLTGGRDFFLGMQDGADYQRDTDAMRRIVREDDLASVTKLAREEAARALSGNAIDLPPALSARIPALMVQNYFGVQQDLDQLIEDATVMFHYLFADIDADPAIEARAMDAKDRVNAAIRASMAAVTGETTLIGRAKAAGIAGEPAFDETGLSANMIGIVIGAIPTLSKAACLAVDELLRRPDDFTNLQAAARASDEAVVAGYLWEALRFSPLSPLLYRRTLRDISLGNLSVAAQTMVLASNLSAMFDEGHVPQSSSFLPGRPWETYILWGEGLHRCWGEYINKAILPAMLTPLLAKPGLEVVSPPDGEGTPFFRHYHLKW